MKTTIKDVARLAGVSISTVSRVMNGSKPVNEDIRRRVLQAIRETNYGAGRTVDKAVLGVIMPGDSHTVLDELNAGIHSIAELYGYDIMVGLTDGSPEKELHYIRLFHTLRFQGLIFVGSSFSGRHAELVRRYGLPCVLAGQASSVPGVPSVHIDNVTAAYEAVTYLLQKGCRSVAMIRGTGEMAVGGDRFKGYRQALEDAGHPVNGAWIAESGLSSDEGYAAMRRIMEAGSRPDAVFCSTDWMAIGAMNYLTDRGLKVPGDIAVMGFDNSFMASVVRPRLSSVDYSATEIGRTAARLLVKVIKGEAIVSQHIDIPHDLAIRESTG